MYPSDSRPLTRNDSARKKPTSHPRSPMAMRSRANVRARVNRMTHPHAMATIKNQPTARSLSARLCTLPVSALTMVLTLHAQIRKYGIRRNRYVAGTDSPGPSVARAVVSPSHGTGVAAAHMPATTALLLAYEYPSRLRPVHAET